MSLYVFLCLYEALFPLCIRLQDSADSVCCIAFRPTNVVFQTIPRWLSLGFPTAFVSIAPEFGILQDIHPFFITVSSKYALVSSSNLKRFVSFFRISFLCKIFDLLVTLHYLGLFDYQQRLILIKKDTFIER